MGEAGARDVFWKIRSVRWQPWRRLLNENLDHASLSITDHRPWQSSGLAPISLLYNMRYSTASLRLGEYAFLISLVCVNKS
jgi:hypothetical protein